MNKNIILIFVLILIVASIFYLNNLKPKIVESNESAVIENVSVNGAKELVGINGYVNIDNITIKENIGKKVILVDFWTYSCINCQRTTPYLNDWYEKYGEGLLIIGVHTPEFEFEKDYDNVKKAVEREEIKYPVVLDNNYQTWRAYENRYWPRKYLIDINGEIVYDHIGEGGYVETEKKIQKLIEERNEVLGLNENVDLDVKEEGIKLNYKKTSEIYFGYGFSREQMGNVEGWKPEEIVDYSVSENFEMDKFYLNGSWKNNKDNMESLNGQIFLNYTAEEVNLVSGGSGKVDVYLDGEFVKSVEVYEEKLYELIDTERGNHLVRLDVEEGVEVYTFTFG